MDSRSPEYRSVEQGNQTNNNGVQQPAARTSKSKKAGIVNKLTHPQYLNGVMLLALALVLLSLVGLISTSRIGGEKI